MHSDDVVHADAIVAGAGGTGMLVALCLAGTLGADRQIAIVDHQGQSGHKSDPRCYALSAGSRNVLKRLGLWQALDAASEDVTQIAISDSPLEAAVRPILLRYDNTLDDGTPAASIVPGNALISALRDAVEQAPNIAVFRGVSVSSSDARSGDIRLTGDDGRVWVGRLLVGADGSQSRVRELAGIKTVLFPHEQVGIVTTIAHERPHGGCATQHFLPGGPFAILPLPGNCSCITWSEGAAEARRILSLDDRDFLFEIDRRIAGQLGDIQLAGARASFPLSTRVARSFVGPRTVLAGDAAHGVHPIAGQGLNLAIRDAAALADAVGDADRVGLDVGDRTAIERYEKWRRFDSTVSAGAFDALNRLFTQDFALLRSARETGLGIVDKLPQLKRLLVREAAGLTGDVPKMMRE